MATIHELFMKLDEVENKIDAIFRSPVMASCAEVMDLERKRSEIRHSITMEAVPEEMREAVKQAAKEVQELGDLRDSGTVTPRQFERAVQRYEALRESLRRRINAAVTSNTPEEFEELLRGSNFALLLLAVA